MTRAQKAVTLPLMKIKSKHIKHIAIVHRSHSRRAKSKALEIQKFLQKRNVTTQMLSQKQTGGKSAANSQLIIAIGGDGTYLKAVHFGKEKDIPVLGINMGSFGFLTPHNETNVFDILDKFFADKLFLRKHFFIKGEAHQITIPKQSKKDSFSDPPPALKSPKEIFQAVNDMVIERGALSHLISLSIYINSQFICSVKSDGLIVAGTLGSTAYNLAAGGPILHPEVQSFVITPICSHSLTNRPVIIHNKSEIKIKVNNKKAFLTIDGIRKGVLTPQNILVIKKDKKSFYSLTEKKQWEFELLREKLQFGQRN